MRTAARPSEDSSSDPLSSSTRTATHAPPSAGDGSYYYSYSSGSGSYSTTTEDSDASSVASSTEADSESAETATSDAASTFSVASGSRDRETAAAAPLASQVSAASSSVAIVAAAPLFPDGKGEEAAKAARGALVAKVVRTSTSTTDSSGTSNGVTVDDADALVPVSSSSPLSSPKSLADPAAPASPYHFSEEELARQPWTVECDATTHTSEENGGQLIARVPDALATIHTVPIAVPPPVEEAQRRRREGGLPFPSHLTFRIVPGAGGAVGESGGAAGNINADAAAQAKKAKEGKTKLDDDKRKPGLWTRFKRAVSNTWCVTYFCGDKEELRRCAEERAEARQRSYHTQLRSHHVPLVNFRTTRDATQNLLDGDNTLPTVEEAAGYRHCVEDMTGAEAEPKQLHKAMRQRRRPASGLHWRTKYAYGRRAGGGPHGSGESAFVREGDPQRFWIAQLHERSQVHLEQIETE